LCKEDFMLVLTRKKGQRVRIGSTVEVTVLEVRGGCVKLGFDAPEDISIRRDEITARFSAHGGPAAAASRPLRLDASFSSGIAGAAHGTDDPRPQSSGRT
jgi:carbon storage regulator